MRTKQLNTTNEGVNLQPIFLKRLQLVGAKDGGIVREGVLNSFLVFVYKVLSMRVHKKPFFSVDYALFLQVFIGNLFYMWIYEVYSKL